MIQGGLARGTFAYFASAFVAFCLAQALVIAGVSYPAAALVAPGTLVAVHLITIGWLTILILGALRQFVPVIAASQPSGNGAALWALCAIDLGLLGMLAGFLALDGTLPMNGFPWLPAGGTLVILGIATVLCSIAATLWRARPLPLAGRFAAAGLVFLVATILLGLLLTFALTHGQWLPRGMVAPLLSGGLDLHASLGIAGWFTLTAMGVAYKLLAMFLLAPEERGARGLWGLWLTVGGLAVAVLARIASLIWPGTAAITGMEWSGDLVAAAGVVVYLLDIRKMYGERRRKDLELNGRFGGWAMVGLGIAAVLAVAWAVASALGRVGIDVAPVVYLLMFGWLSGLGLSQMYKIVPFLTWIDRFGSRLGKGAVPRVQDLVVESRARPWFLVYFASVALGVVAALLNIPMMWRAAAAVTLLATLGIGLEVWRARHADPEPQPVTGPAWLKAAGIAGNKENGRR